MAIKKVDDIPQTLAEKRESYREMIRTDIQSAIDSGITKFEFDGDYNYKYLAQYVREELRKMIGTIVMKRGKEIEIERFPYYKPRWSPWRSYRSEQFAKKLYSVTSKKGDDRTHVYCELRLNLLDDVCVEIIEDDVRKEKDVEERRKARLEREAKKG